MNKTQFKTILSEKIKNILKKYENLRRKLFIKLCDLFKQQEGVYLKWYMLIFYILIFPIDSILWRIRSTGNFVRNLPCNTVIIFGEEISMNELYKYLHMRAK